MARPCVMYRPDSPNAKVTLPCAVHRIGPGRIHFGATGGDAGGFAGTLLALRPEKAAQPLEAGGRAARKP